MISFAGRVNVVDLVSLRGWEMGRGISSANRPQVSARFHGNTADPIYRIKILNALRTYHLGMARY